MKKKTREVVPFVLSLSTVFFLLADSSRADTFTVTSTSDSGPGSLRAAVTSANGNGIGVDTIGFDAPLAGSTIVLTSGEIQIVTHLDIVGPTTGDPASISIDGNSADLILSTSGAGLNLSLENLTLTNGNSPWGGGALWIGHLTGSSIRVNNNSSVNYGGGIRASGNVVLSNCEVKDNESTGSNPTDGGGGIYADGSVSLTNCDVSGNSANYRWGGIRTGGNLTLTGSSVSNNSAGDLGGGVVAGGNLAITDSVISGNTAVQRGGGIFHLGGANTVTIKNSTISGNSSTGSNGGGFFGSGGTFSIINSTITGNSASGDGDGIYLDGSVLDLENTVLSGNTGGKNLYIDLLSHTVTVDHSLVGTDVTIDVDNGGVIVSDTPGLNPLANNGGPTLTHALQPTSSALDAGDNALVPSGLYNDQRGGGFLRVADGDGSDGAAVDIGAYEFNPSAIGLDVASASADEDAGSVDLYVTRTGSGSGAASVNFATADSGASAGSDYTANSGSLNWEDGQLGTRTLSVVILDSPDPESDEDFTVTLSSSTGVDALGTAVATVTIVDNDAPLEFDYGDAPDPTYATLLANGGPRHGLGSGLLLGTQADSELDGQPSIAADGDDTQGADDEDGVAFTSGIELGADSTGADVLTVTVSADGKLDAWIDFNGDGDWTDASEQVFTNTMMTTEGHAKSFTSFAEAVPGSTYARFRLSTGGGLGPTGLAADGEVEDYRVTIKPVDDLDLIDRLESTKRTFWACNSIAAGDPTDMFNVLDTGEITFHAGSFVAIRNGFEVLGDGSLVVQLGSVPGCP